MNGTELANFRRFMEGKGYREVHMVGKYKIEDFDSRGNASDKLYIKNTYTIPIT